MVLLQVAGDHLGDSQLDLLCPVPGIYVCVMCVRERVLRTLYCLTSAAQATPLHVLYNGGTDAGATRMHLGLEVCYVQFRCVDQLLVKHTICDVAESGWRIILLHVLLCCRLAGGGCVWH